MVKNLFTLILTLFAALSTVSQSLPDPEFLSRPYVLTDDNVLKNLERADAEIDVKVKGMGYGGTEIFYVAFSPKSDVRFDKNSLPRLIIKLEGSIDPAEIILLSKGEVKRDRRRFIQGSRALGGKARDVSSSYVEIRFKKIEGGLFEIVLPSDLQPGEYAFTPVGTVSQTPFATSSTKTKISCFGID
jgi:hypothetical protein